MSRDKFPAWRVPPTATSFVFSEKCAVVPRMNRRRAPRVLEAGVFRATPPPRYPSVSSREGRPRLIRIPLSRIRYYYSNRPLSLLYDASRVYPRFPIDILNHFILLIASSRDTYDDARYWNTKSFQEFVYIREEARTL